MQHLTKPSESDEECTSRFGETNTITEANQVYYTNYTLY